MNAANGENNQDGERNNLSDNCGVEGESDDAQIEAIRSRQIRNFFATLMFSQGIPMFVMGDEARRTQRGNNNAYCQDNEISWFDWRMVESNAALVRFFREMIRFRTNQPTVRRRHFLTGKNNGRGPLPDVSWFNPLGQDVDWSRPDDTIACLLAAPPIGEDPLLIGRDVLVLFNPTGQPVEFRVPQFVIPDQWRLLLDTSREPPDDIFPNYQGPMLPANRRVPLLNKSMAAFARP